MHVHRYERVWLAAGFAILVVLLATITSSAIVEGFVPPSRVQTIDPARVSTTPPFDHPGLRRIAAGEYEAYYVAQIFAFEPAAIVVPVGSRVTFYVTSTDVVHGFFIPGTSVNATVTPGWVSSATHVFRTRGTYLLACHEYCGIGHQNMAARVEVR